MNVPYRINALYNNGDGLAYPMDSLFPSYSMLNLDCGFTPNDGNGLVSFDYLGTGTPQLVSICGWPSPNSFKEIWLSEDNGFTFTQQTDFPGVARHTFTCLVVGNKIWVMGGDYLTGSYAKDIWYYTYATGWVNVTMDWGSLLGDRVLFASWTDGTYIYIAGGQNNYTSPTMFTDIIRYTPSTNTTVKIADLPTGLNYFSAGCGVYYNSRHYLLSGGRYLTPHDNLNTKVYRSTNSSGTSYEEIADLPNEMKALYAACYVYNSKIYYLMGAFDGYNVAGFWTTNDGITWQDVYATPPATHAAPLTIHNNALHCVAGNLNASSWRFDFRRI